MREVLEEIVTHADDVDPQTLGEILRYTKLFWINTGPFNNLTARKFILNVTPEDFAAAAHAATAVGAAFPVRSGETLDQLLARLEPMFFDPDVDAVVTKKSRSASEDMLLPVPTTLRRGVDARCGRLPRALSTQFETGEARRAGWLKRSTGSTGCTGST